MRELSDPSRYEFNPEAQMKKVKMRGMSQRRCVMLYELIRWREDQAKRQNIPRGWVLKDITLRDLVSNPPKNAQELARIRGIGGMARTKQGQQILDQLQAAKTPSHATCPPTSRP